MAASIPIDSVRGRHLQALGRLIDERVVDPLGPTNSLIMLVLVAVLGGRLVAIAGGAKSEPRPSLPRTPKPAKAAPPQTPDPALARRMAAAASPPPRSPPVEVDRSGPILISRRPRRPGDGWDAARSWFGGLPHIGERVAQNLDRKPMVFLAQIDLAEVAEAAPDAPIRHQGALAFFIGPGPKVWEAAVVHAPAGAAETPLPPEATKTHEATGEIFPNEPTPWARDRFHRWPVQFTAFKIPHVPVDCEDGDQIEEADRIYWEQIRARFHRPETGLDYRKILAALGEGAPRFWWRGVQIYADTMRVDALHRDWIDRARTPYARKVVEDIAKLRETRREAVDPDEAAQIDADLAKAEALREKHEADAASLDRQSARIGAFIAKVDAVAARHDAWTAMTADELASFQRLHERSKEEFPDLLRSRMYRTIDDLMLTSLLEMFTGDEEAFAAMPAPARELINETQLLSSGPIHQMFGSGDDIQGAAVPENAGNHLLLKLGYDDMMGWRFGDVGVFQFWISPADLAAGNWKAVEMTFEAH